MLKWDKDTCQFVRLTNFASNFAHVKNKKSTITIKKLKENKNFNTLVIALTADALSGAKEKYMQEGFADYIAKPFSRDQIKEKLDKIFKD